MTTDMKKQLYKTTYSSTRHFSTFTTKRAAIEQARYAIAMGNMRSCVHKRLPSGRWQMVKCVSRYRKGR
jgi:hypothetical protein